MDPQLQYATVAFPDARRVLGVRLLPLSVGHALLLDRIQSPFAPYRAYALTELPGFGDVVEALWILSRPASIAAEQRVSLRGKATIAAWTIRARLSARFQPWRWFTVADAAERLLRIARDARTGPTLWVKEGSDKPQGAPFLASLKVTLMRFFRCTEREALDYPLRRALWDTSVWWEMHGSGEIETRDLSHWKPDAPQPSTQPSAA